MNTQDIKEVIRLHALWEIGDPNGKKANLRSADLRGADLRGANLRGADLSGADLRSADLRGANLRSANLGCADLRSADLGCADLRSADLSGANLGCADLRSADLSGADLSGANLGCADLRSADLSGANLGCADLRSADLRSADLRGANLRGADLSGAMNSKFALALTEIVPREGEFVGWKKCQDNIIVKLLIPKDAKRSNATGRKCRASHVVVLDVIGGEIGFSNYKPSEVYKTGMTVTCDKWCNDRFNECAGGIHFFLTKDEAEVY